MSPAKPCLRCGNLTRAGSYCAECAPRNGSTRKWRRTRERVMRRDGWTCRCPGCPECRANAPAGGELQERPKPAESKPCSRAYPLEVDHVNGDPEDNRQANLRTLCVRCHRHHHHGTVLPRKTRAGSG